MCAYGSKCRYDHVRPKTTLPARTAAPPAIQATYLPNELKKMTVLKKSEPTQPIRTEWAEAPAFIPSFASGGSTAYDSYAPTAAPANGNGGTTFASLFAEPEICEELEKMIMTDESSHNFAEVLCPYAAATGECTVENCQYLHGDMCPCCRRLCLHPDDPEGNTLHIDECVALVEQGIKQSELEERSAMVDCSICMEKVLEKSDLADRRCVFARGVVWYAYTCIVNI
jgi:E3 ubiquitin-protein ligase makorin